MKKKLEKEKEIEQEKKELEKGKEIEKGTKEVEKAPEREVEPFKKKKTKDLFRVIQITSNLQRHCRKLKQNMDMKNSRMFMTIY